MSDPDPFDEIVRHLDIDLPFPEAGVPGPKSRSPEPDEHFYRRVTPREPAPHHPRILLAWSGVIGGPAAIMAAGVLRLMLPRPILLGIGFVFVASAIYLIAQLPERGPGEPNWPDDGAQL